MGIGIVLPIIYLSNCFHSAFPNTIQHVKSKHLSVPKIIHSSIITAFILFTLIGIIVLLAVSDPESMMTINWIDYTGGNSDQSWWSLLIMYFIILLPALGIISIYPIQAIALSDNIISLRYGKFSSDEMTKWTFYIYRLLVVVFPVATAGFFYSLGFILDFAGSIVIFAIGFFIPLMTIVSKKIVIQKGEFDYWFAGNGWSWFIYLAIWSFLL